MDFKDLKPNTFYTRIVDSGFDVFTFKNTYNNSYLVCDVAFRKNWSICSVQGIRFSTPDEQHWLEECIKKDEFIPKTSIIKKELSYIVGKWYKTIMGSFVKYNRTTDDGIFESSEYIDYYDKKYYKNSACFGPSKHTNNFTEAILHEFERYLPNGHPDKIKNTSADMDIPDYIKNAPFKIGQTVKLKSTGTSVNFGNPHGASQGDIVTITKINDLEGSASKKDPRYYGVNFNVRGCDLEAVDEIVSKDILVHTNISQSQAYVKCIKIWSGNTNSIVDKIYDTSIEPDFSVHNWKELLKTSEYFIASTKEAFDKQHNPVINITVGECFVVTQEKSNFVGKQDYCYKRIESSDKNLFYISSDRAVDPTYTKVRPASIKETLYYDNIKSEFNINDMTVVENLEKILDSWCLNVRKATLAEERSYFDSKAKKEPAKDTSAEYKLGDWFFVQQNTTSGCHLTVGKVYQIQDINGDYWVEAKEYGADGGQIFLKDIRKALPHEIPVQDSLAVPIPKKKVIISDIIEIKKLKTF